MKVDYDVIIIGGGPAGSSAGMRLGRLGRRVLIVEKERFPRFHIGESLLPYNMPLMREMGVMEAVESGGFAVRKHGAQFILGDGSKGVAFRFAQGTFNEEHRAFHVERARFDELLLNRARALGAEVREGCAVTGWRILDWHAEVDTQQGETLTAQFVMDASGTQNFTANREGIRELREGHRKLAVFGHFKNVGLPGGEQAGDIVIVRLPSAWAWVIPLAGKVSVGVVLDQKEVKASGLRPEQLFARAVASSKVLRQKMAGAEAAGPLHTIADYSYRNRRMVSPRLMRVGDAAGFMDPIFSSGVHLAMQTGWDGAAVIHQALRQNQPLTAAMRRYERRTQRWMAQFWALIERFYTQPFTEVFLEPRTNFDLASGVNAILAGRVRLNWAIRWRLWAFYSVVFLQRWVEMVPRITKPAQEEEGCAPRQEAT